MKRTSWRVASLALVVALTVLLIPSVAEAKATGSVTASKPAPATYLDYESGWVKCTWNGLFYSSTGQSLGEPTVVCSFDSLAFYSSLTSTVGTSTKSWTPYSLSVGTHTYSITYSTGWNRRTNQYVYGTASGTLTVTFSGVSFGVSGDLKSLPMFYTSAGVPTYDNLRPLVGYVSHANMTLGGWMYHGILFYTGSLYYTSVPKQTDCDAWTASLFSSGWLDTLNTVVGDLKTQLGNNSYHLNVFLTTCYASDVAHGNTIQNDQHMIDLWANKKYAHLTLAGFYWGYFEAPGDAGVANCDVKPTSDYLHGLNTGLKTVWIPYYNVWRDTATVCTDHSSAAYNTNWMGWGFDYVTAQPNYAFDSLLDWNRFATIGDPTKSGSDIVTYGLAGGHFEIAYTRNGLSIEQNANAYLDAGFQYEWMKNRLNTFFFAPNFLSHYADGKGSIPGYPPAPYDPQPFDRAIYDRQWEFIRGYASTTLSPIADSYVQSYYPNTNAGTDTRLIFGTNFINVLRPYLKWNLYPAVPYASYIMKATMSLYLQSWAYGAFISDGQLYGVGDNSWTETGITWSNQPSTSTWSLRQSGIAFSSAGSWYSFDVTSDVQYGVTQGGGNVSFMLKRATEDTSALEPIFDSREYSAANLRPQLAIEFVKSQLVRQVLTEDSFVAGAPGYQDTNYGSWDHMIFGTNAHPNMLRPYLKVRLDAFKSSSVEYQGKLVLHLTQFYYGSDIFDGQLYFISTNAWQESAITWNNQPTSANWQLRYDNLHFSSSTWSYSFVINSDLVNSWSAGSVSFMLKRAVEDLSNVECGFWSREYIGDLAVRAEIRVTLAPY